MNAFYKQVLSLYNDFKIIHRRDKDIVTINDRAKDLVRLCHNNGSILPNDFIYKTIYEILKKLVISKATYEKAHSSRYDIVTSLVCTNVQINDLFDWAKAHYEYIDECVGFEQYKSFIELMKAGQHAHISGLYTTILDYVIDSKR